MNNLKLQFDQEVADAKKKKYKDGDYKKNNGYGLLSGKGLQPSKYTAGGQEQFRKWTKSAKVYLMAANPD